VSDTLDTALETIAKIRVPESREEALDSASVACAKAGHIPEALRLVGLYRQGVEEALAYVDSAEALERFHQGDERASKSFQDMSLFQLRLSWSLKEIALSRTRNENLQEALGYVLLIPHDDSDRFQCLESIAFLQATSGDTDGALRWIMATQIPSVKSFALLGVAKALIEMEKK
jgi:hypothetical protein